jgi:hypothetical protein
LPPVRDRINTLVVEHISGRWVPLAILAPTMTRACGRADKRRATLQSRFSFQAFAAIRQTFVVPAA